LFGLRTCRRSQDARLAEYRRATVRVHEYPCGHLAIFHGPHRLADYNPEGKPRMMPNWRHEPLGQPACGFVDNAARCPQPHGHNHHKKRSIDALRRPVNGQLVNLTRQQQLLPQQGELYVLAQSRDRVAKERAIGRRQLKRLWARLKQLSTMKISREER
jgi:hypothetical protein